MGLEDNSNFLSKIAKTSKDEAPKFQPSTVRKEGRTIVIEARCTGVPTPTFKWTKDGNEIKPRIGKYEMNSRIDGTVCVQILRILVSLVLTENGL